MIRSAERHDPELERLAAGFREEFAAPVNVHVYCTPTTRSGFSWHLFVSVVIASPATILGVP